MGEGVAYRLGGEALEALNTRLAGRGSFFASGASAVDATAFSYLTAVLRCPLPRDTLRAHLKSLPALCSYVEAFSTTFFGSFEPLLPSPETDPRLRPPPLTGRPTAFPYAFGADEGGGGEASEAAAGGGKSSRTPKQRRFKERSRNAVLGALGGALVYAVATDLVGGEEELDEYAADEQQ